ncbi:hypothetical protein Pcinc_000205 [Petrolisthes cinctipes]|uniref:Uncharacterized protein n=1 Tax=Petrolisthes cinctipes TaxID=88211 RepID=A0AAE1L5I8_PETCI|nr:hypothetical protein Pcinc_000205 [Petrolisthes cinctipes]
MNSDVRVTDNASKARVHATSFDSEPESLTTAVTKLQGKQEKIEECMINLTKQMSTLAENIQRTETGVKNSSECWYHGTNAHDITKCSGFQRLANNDKMDAVRQMGACFRCLRLGHVGRQCTRSVSCSECGRNHHWMIHSCLSKPEAHASSNVLSWSKALLMISSAYSNAYPITTLWDPGSDMNLITNRMAKHLGLKGRSISLEVTRVGNVCSKFETLEYNVPLNDCHGNIHNVRACGISEITSEARPVDTTSVAALWGIQDKDIARPHEPKESVTKRLQAFFDVESLGIHCNPKCGNCKCGKCPLGSNKYSVKEERELALITKGLSHDPEKNRWIAIYPWIKSPETLPNNLSVSLARLRSTEKRLSKRGAKYAKAYSDQMQDMVARGVARKLTDEEMRNYEGPVHYIPHHEVLRPESKSTPIRIVFNSSASYMGHVLNDYYAKGPDVLNDLFGILLRFREKPVAIVGDISKMYNSVLISELDQMTHRFLWRNMNPDKNPDHYCLQTVTFGDRPSGIIAMTALHKTAEMLESEYPEAAAMLIHDSYVDDVIHSCDTVSEALRKLTDTGEILKVGGFQIKQWVISGDHDKVYDKKLVDTEMEKVLGMRWEPKKDQFIFKVSINFSKKYKKVHTEPNLTVDDIIKKAPNSLTKRMILSQVASLYDPLGLATPFTMRCKLLLTQLITLKNENDGVELGWDDPIPYQMYNQWIYLFTEMYELEKVKFKRCVRPDTAVGNPILVMYSDASNAAYATCAYVRFKLQSCTYSSQLLAAKSRVAPVRQITIPRLELCAAALSARMRKVIEKESRFEFEEVLHLTDSMIVRSQIQKESHGFGTFVATRIVEIQALTNTDEWWWTTSTDNAADFATRPQHPSKMGSDSLWQTGPKYLTLSKEQWPISQPCIQELPDRSCITLTCDVKINHGQEASIIDIKCFSSYERMINTTAMILLLCKRKSFKGLLHNLTSADLKQAENYWIKIVQREFAGDWEKRFKRSGPCVNENGIITVGERISKWLKDDWNQDKFILLSRSNPFTILYIQHLHNNDHGGVDLTLAKLQRKFWVPGARKVIKLIKEKCVICKKIDKPRMEQQMGQLPDKRLKPSPAFYNTALDLFGPILIRDTVKRRSRAKVYGVIFTCFTSRAVYLDLTEGYDTDSFLSTFRRFVSIRGYPQTIHSDMGTQLTAASKEIRNMMGKWNTSQISTFSLNQGTTWSFNKSANAPWQNGICEALIKTVKRLLVIAVGECVLSFGELQTVLFEVANLLNERPIGLKPGYDIDMGAYLCPNDLLLGRSSNKVPSGPMGNEPDVRKRFTIIQTIVTTFWKRWMRDYFPTLLVRHKWHTERRNLQKGDIVLVQDNDLVRGNWRLAQVFQANAGKDGKVRDVVLRYKPLCSSDEYKGRKDRLVNRSVHRLVLLLPIEDQ